MSFTAFKNVMRYFCNLSTALLGFGVALVQIQAAQALTNTEIKNIAQSITVQIQAAQNPKDYGSGVIMRRDGQTYIVLTARHVVEAARDFEVKTPDGEIYPIKQESIRYLPNVDLALLKFNSTRSYSIAKMGDTNQSQPGSASFVAGFTEKDFYFDVGKININANGSLVNGYTLGLDNFVLSG